MAEKGDRTREDLVSCAQRLFYEHGYDGTSFARIVEASGLQRGHIYHFFKSKDDILRAVVARHHAEFAAILEGWNRELPDPKRRLDAFAEMILGRRADLAAFGCPVGTLNSELAKDRRDLQGAARGLFDLLRDWLAAQFVALGMAAEEAPLRALRWLAQAQGVALIAHVYADEEFLAREIAWLKAGIATLREG